MINPMSGITPSLTAERTETVERHMTVGHFVPGMPFVYATPMMILLMEMTSGDAINPYLPQGFASVGMEVNIRHLAATPVGRMVRATAKVIEVDGRRVNFEVVVYDGDRKIGEGTHRRGVIDTAQFKSRFGAD
jgi:predicted thioesterase